MANWPHQAAEYYKSRHVPYLEKLIEHYPWKADPDPNKYLGLGEQQPGDLIFQSFGPGGLAKDATKALGGSAIRGAKELPKIASHVAETAGNKLPILKSIASSPYKKQNAILESKDLLTGYTPHIPDILEATRLLKSEGMKIPHEAINLAAQKALQGNFKPWFSLQSSVRSEGRRLTNKGGVHRELGQELHGLAEKMHKEMGTQQSVRGAPEAARYGEQGKQRYARYHKISPIAKIAEAGILPSWLIKLKHAYD